MTQPTAAVPLPSGPARRFPEATASGVPNTLRGWGRHFLRFGGPRAITATLAASAATRLAMGRFRPADARVAAQLVLVQPFTEWLLHVYVLHRPPRRRGDRTAELYAARKHREHHLDPLDIDLALVQPPILAVGIPSVLAVQALLTRDRRLALSGMTTSMALLLVYEWVHYLIHSPYVPRSAWYRGLWRGHRLHHYKNEHYWFGITSRLGDRVLRTNPGRGAVDTSPTARTLAAA